MLVLVISGDIKNVYASIELIKDIGGIRVRYVSGMGILYEIPCRLSNDDLSAIGCIEWS